MPSRMLGVFSSCSCVNIHLDEDGATAAGRAEFADVEPVEPTASGVAILIYLYEHLGLECSALEVSK
ncbi:unnamed protein product [Toxocara canis]|uniref:Redox-sensing transcriptional repressor Rex n=1 Tax=Toxocara canis TaxID=6265 RepID=A0A183US43_TOXCA|nr:unnamed protein product [Toxocara canis]